jgi:acyl carrier protein
MGGHLTVGEEVKSVLGQILRLEATALRFDASTALFGSIPELDSRAVVTLIAALEDKFGIIVEDDEITAEIFETVGSLTEFVERKLAA